MKKNTKYLLKDNSYKIFKLSLTNQQEVKKSIAYMNDNFTIVNLKVREECPFDEDDKSELFYLSLIVKTDNGEIEMDFLHDTFYMYIDNDFIVLQNSDVIGG